MGDWTRSCPACHSHTSAIGHAFAEGESCPYCGLPAEVVDVIDRAARKGVEGELVERLAQAEQRAAAAEVRAASLESALSAVRRICDANGVSA